MLCDMIELGNDRDLHGYLQRSACIRIIVMHNYPATAKEKCWKEGVQGKATAPDNASEKVEKSELNYTYHASLLCS